MENEIHIWCDGSCSMNPGPGGYAAMIIENNSRTVISGYELNTTNNRMELKALVAGLSRLAVRSDLIPNTKKIIVYTDSKYIENAINCGWLNKWVKKNFKDVKNVDLWASIINLLNLMNPEIRWVKGHSGVQNNELVDEFAKIARDSKYSKQVIMSF